MTYKGKTMEEWREEWERYKPVVPSKDEPWREAECLVCKDTEWLYGRKADGSVDYSVAVPCECLLEREKGEKVRYSLEKSGIPDTRRVNTFETFKRVKGTEEAFASSKILAGGIAGFSLLLLYGEPGNGKTHLAYAACLHAIEAGKRPAFKPILELFTELRLAMDKPDSSPDQIIEDLKKVDLLVLDDLGAQPFDKKSEWGESKIEELINYRYAHRKPMIITMNRNPSTLSQPILSRLKDPEVSRMILNEAPDYRRRRDGKEKG